MIFSISWKNIWRSRLRSIIVMTAVAIGMIGGIFTSAIFKGMSDKRTEEAIKYEVSHLQIHHSDYFKNEDINYTIPNTKRILNEIKTYPEIESVSNRLEVPVMIKSSSTGTGVKLVGINPDHEKGVTSIFEAVYDSVDVARELNVEKNRILKFVQDSCGQYFKENTRYKQIVIGEKLAEQLKVDIKSKVVTNLQTADGELTGGVFRVVGIYRITNSQFENSMAFVKKDDLHELTGLNEGAAHEIAIRLNNDAQLKPIMKKLKAEFPDVSVMSWKELQPELGMMTEWMNVMLYVIMVIILLALGFGIVNTMLMVVMERVKELGMLMAIGMNRARVFSMIMLETILLSLTGGVIGMGIAALLVNYFGNVGIDLSLFSKGFEAIGFSSILYPQIGLVFYFTITILIIVTAILASIYPALKALKLKPAEALRIEI
jgi:ABC-type lipoprotein release transport system permease subunit